jgi:intracellular multiplication protein IcmE
MSGAFAKLGHLKASLPRVLSFRPLNSAGTAGPRRLMILGAVGLGVVGAVALVASGGKKMPIVSQDARMSAVDPLPGGLHSTPEQDALARSDNDAAAQKAEQKGISYTPPLAPSQPAVPPPSRIDIVDSPHPDAPFPKPIAAHPPAAKVPAPLLVAFPVPQPLQAAAHAVTAAQEPSQVRATTVASPADTAAEAEYRRQIGDMFSQWGGHVPRTDVVMPPASGQGSNDPPEQHSASNTAGTVRGAAALPVSDRAEQGQILVPAGRGVFAHPILALSSDQSSPVVLQADSGPIAGDRMIGTFAKQVDRLVIHINTLIHNGETIGVDGLVTAPDTMEAGVATDVDQHYAARFILPAAAAFVAGLGQAIATTSNTAAVLSPFGGATTSTHLNIDQQLGVAAGASAAQIGSTLAAAAPKGPTVSLEANVAVGVMFLSNVTAHPH